VAGATVAACDRAFAGVTDVAGRVAFSLAAPWLGRLRGAAPGFVAASGDRVAAVDGIVETRLMLVRSARLTVFARLDGAPASGVDVRLLGLSPEGEVAAPRDFLARISDGDGRAVFDVPPSTLTVTCLRADLEPATSEVDVPVSGADVRIDLARGSTFEVRVVDAAGAPCPFAAIQVRDGSRISETFVADVAGRFDVGVKLGRTPRFDAPPESGYSVVEAGVDGAAVARYRVVLRFGETVACRVLRSDGALVDACLLETRDDVGRVVTTVSRAREGLHAVDRQAFAGAGLFRFRHDAYGASPWRRCLAPPPGGVRDVLLEPWIAARGRVVDRAGRPQPGARVVAYASSTPPTDAFREAFAARATADKTGAFTLSLAPTEAYRLQAALGAVRSAWKTAGRRTPESSFVADVALPDAGAVDLGAFLLAETGSLAVTLPSMPAGLRSVLLVPRSPGAQGPQRLANAGAGGRAVFSDLVPGAYGVLGFPLAPGLPVMAWGPAPLEATVTSGATTEVALVR
ncbi:MAG TPA: carboxypeptidase-like regulatory domain-containing protein, partial [Planctomycetota bacterium]|nr:carboxypeptidase-like regulatory domain-containing protein [Planctomycetota bacterium]